MSVVKRKYLNKMDQKVISTGSYLSQFPGNILLNLLFLLVLAVPLLALLQRFRHWGIGG